MRYRAARIPDPLGDLVLSTEEDWSGPATFLLKDVAGWYGGVGVTDGGPQRGLGHGAFPQSRHRGPRAITVTGSIRVQDAADRDVLDRHVSGLFADGEQRTLTVTHGDTTLSADVELESEISHAYVGTHGIALQIVLTAPDPFLYGPVQETTIAPPGLGQGLKWEGGLFSAGHLRWGGAQPPARMENRGNAEAWPRFLVQGNFPEGFRLTVNGRVVEWPGIVTARSPVEVDYGSGQVMVGGRDATHMLVHRQWESIPAGGAIAPRLTARSRFSEGWATATWSDTFI